MNLAALTSSLALVAVTALSPVREPPLSPRVVDCATPAALRLTRFEDGSARLLCGRRLLVRVHVPG